MRNLALLFVAVAFVPTSDAAAQQFKAVEEKDSLVVIDLPELARHARSYSYGQSANYTIDFHYGAALPRAGTYPRLQIMLDQLAPAYYFGRQEEIAEATVRQTWPFFKDRQIADMQSLPGGGNARLRIARFRGENVQCFAFEAHVGSPDVRHGYAALTDRQRVRGYFCGYPGSSLSDAEVAHVLSGIKIMNPGATADLPGARSSSFGRPQAASPAPAAQPPSPADTQGRDVLPFRPALIGTRMHLSENGKDAGYIQVTGVSGTTVTVVNASSQTLRFRAGLFSTRNGSKFVGPAIGSLWPLHVGKRLEFEEVNGEDRWHNVVQVLRREAITTPAGTFDTWVIELQERALMPAQGGFERTRTYWYAPEAGLHVRLRSAQGGGPPVRLFNWDAAQIVKP